MLVDEEGRSLLHKAESPEQITLLLQNPLTDVNATNRVRQASLVRIDGALRPSLAPPVCFLLSDLLRANSILLPQAGQTPLQTHARSPHLMVPLLAGGADPNLPLDKEGSTLLHQAQTPREITALLESPLIEVDATNQVRSFVADLLLTIDIRSHVLSASPLSIARLITTRPLHRKPRRPAKRRFRRMPSRPSCGRHYSPAEPTRTSR